MIPDKVIKIATLVREACDDLVLSRKASKYDFYRKDDLSCMCGIASATLSKILKRFKNCNVQLINGRFIDKRWHTPTWFDHCWVQYNDHIIDITATQFGIHNKVNICKIGNKLYRLGRVMRTYDDFYNWSTGQRPNHEIINQLIKRVKNEIHFFN
jgi:hypothetical protein